MALPTVRLADSRAYGKFFRMLRMGLPEAAVRQAMRVQRVDERVLALGEDALLSAVPPPPSPAPQPPSRGPQVDDRVFRHSLRMLLVGVPEAAVEMHMKLRMNQQAFEQTLGKVQATLARRTAAALGVLDAGVPRRLVVAPPTPTSAGKFEEMERVGVPTAAVNQAIKFAAAGAETAPTAKPMTPWAKFFLIASVAPSTIHVGPDTALEDHPLLTRFFAMLRAGVGVDAVRFQLDQVGLPRELADWDPAQPLAHILVN